MTPPGRRPGLLSLLLLLLVVGLLAAPGAHAAEPSGKVAGEVRESGTGRTLSGIKVLVFDKDWGYLRSFKASGNGSYGTAAMAPGTYYLQFTDTRPRYDVKHHLSRDVKVVVTAGRTVVKDVRMQRGGAVTGTVHAGSKRAAGARVVAANQYGTSYEVKADSRGRFAIGGLPQAKYTLFTWDKGKRWTAKGRYLGTVKPGRFTNTTVRMKTRAGALRVDLYAGSSTMQTTTTITLVNRSTGQWWVARVVRGSVTVKGLAPGTYRAIVPGVDGYVGRTVTLLAGESTAARVRSGRTGNAYGRLHQRGGSLTGQVVDATSSQPLQGVLASVYDAKGTQLGKVATGADGRFTVGGSIPTTQCGITLVLEAEQPIAGQRYVSLRDQQLSATAGQTVSVPQVPVAGGGCQKPSAGGTQPGPYRLVRNGPVDPAPTPTPTPTTTPAPTPTPTTPTPTPSTTPDPSTPVPTPSGLDTVPVP